MRRETCSIPDLGSGLYSHAASTSELVSHTVLATKVARAGIDPNPNMQMHLQLHWGDYEFSFKVLLNSYSSPDLCLGGLC